jgi:hypothetical protein
LTTSEGGNLIDITSGTFTQTFDACATLSSGWFCYIRNSGTGDVELESPGAVSTTSVTSNSIAAGTTWTVGTGLSITAGDLVIVRRTADPFAQRIVGTVSSYTSGTGVLVVTVGYRIGSGTFTDWTITTRAATAGIDGLASFVMYPGEVRLVQCDGTELRSVVITPFYRAFTASGTFTKPPGYSRFGGIIWSAGNSGAKGNSAQGRSGGGGGGAFPFELPASLFGTSTTITIGAGGAAVTAAATDGNRGGNSSLGSLLTVCSGSAVFRSGGSVDNPYSSGNSINNSGVLDSGFAGGSTAAGGGALSSAIWGGGSAGFEADSGASIWGGGGGGGLNAGGTVFSPGTSRFGGAGGAASMASNGTAGTAPAGGGGATDTGAQSGAGARGEIRIWGAF